MAKAGGALPSWFWPNGVPRRAPVSQQPLARQFVRLFKPAGDAVALVSPKRRISYGELDAMTFPLASSLASAVPAGAPGTISPIAICESDPASATVLMVLCWAAAKPVLLLDPAADVSTLAAQMKRANCSVVLTEDDPGNAKLLTDITLVRRGELKAPTGMPKPVPPPKVTDAALLVPDDKGILVHSHYSITGVATSLFTFVAELKEMPFLALAPRGLWESWAGIVSALLNLRTVYFGDFASGTPTTGEPANTYSFLTGTQAEQIVERGQCPPALAGVRHVFVSYGVFSERWRVKLERIIKRPALLVWGNQEIGPAVAAHPSWAPSQAHGFPLVNVTLFPIEAGQGDVSIVPWEMLDRAEIGVEPPAPPLGYLPENPGEKIPPRPKILRTHQVAMVDNVGVITLL